ncbi:MAG: hypothetical protein KDA59_26530, partial [Planctomycetales bacterium]|nr:hypothetical protein [Planctomycetales bacterium]
VVEWPGGEPRRIDFDVTPEEFRAVKKGRISVPLGDNPDLAELGGLPWCSIATIHAGGEKLHRIVGPAIKQTTGGALPVLSYFFDQGTGLSEYKREAEKLRKAWGLGPVET